MLAVQWARSRRTMLIGEAVKEKKYTEDHEWIEMSADGKTCMLYLLSGPCPPIALRIPQPQPARVIRRHAHA
jgi:hypothetical protein